MKGAVDDTQGADDEDLPSIVGRRRGRRSRRYSLCITLSSTYLTVVLRPLSFRAGDVNKTYVLWDAFDDHETG